MLAIPLDLDGDIPVYRFFTYIERRLFNIKASFVQGTIKRQCIDISVIEQFTDWCKYIYNGP